MASTDKKGPDLKEILRREFKKFYGYKPVGIEVEDLKVAIRQAKNKRKDQQAEKETTWKDKLPDGY